ncbi:MAG: ABC transporter permease [Candidatus Caenarcaniphilales bacterium]|nr:ABC transporter permease [Candidatus Caenarcaniphilales bacterium]
MSTRNQLKFNLSLIVTLYLLAIFASFLSPLSPTESPAKRVSYSSPIKIHFSLHEGLFFYPFILKVDSESFIRKFSLNKEIKCNIKFFTKGFEYKLFGLFKTNTHLMGSGNCPNDFHLLGTDKLGRDYFSRLIHGLRPSLFTGILGVLIAFPLGIIYGTFAGYKGGSTGEVMMRMVEVILSLPTLYLLVVLAAILPPGLTNMQRLSLITVILSLIGWAGLARVVRGQVLSIAKREYVQAAVLIGQSEFKIIIREIIPQLSSYLIIALTLSFPSYILGETTLSFLGLGINQPDPSLGNILAEGRELTSLFLRPWLAIGPTIIIVILTLCFNSLGDQLRDILDPKT